MSGCPERHVHRSTVVSLKLKSDAVTVGLNFPTAPCVTQSALLSPHCGRRTGLSSPRPPAPPHSLPAPTAHCSRCPCPGAFAHAVPAPWCLHDLPSRVLLARCHTVIEVSHYHWI